MHQRYQLHLSGQPSHATQDLQSLFPQLVILLHSMSSAARITPREPPLHLTVYRQICLHTLLSVCQQEFCVEQVTFFGSRYLSPQEEAQPFSPFDIVDIIGLTAKLGACINRPAEARDMSRWRPTTSSDARCLLEADEEAVAEEEADMLAMVMGRS